MADASTDATPWLSVIGKSLAYLCLEKARERDTEKFADTLTKVDFLRASACQKRTPPKRPAPRSTPCVCCDGTTVAKRSARRMAKVKKAAPAAEIPGTTVQDKIAGCLALIAIKGMDTDAAALKLDGIGFTSREIANLLDVGENYVHVARHRKKSGGRKAAPRPADGMAQHQSRYSLTQSSQSSDRSGQPIGEFRMSNTKLSLNAISLRL